MTNALFEMCRVAGAVVCVRRGRGGSGAADLAKIAPPPAATAHALDGVSLAPLLLRNEPPAERTLCWKAGDSWAVRQGAWKAIIQHRGPPELYHLGRDIGERRNLADTEPERLRDLLAAYADWERQFP